MKEWVIRGVLLAALVAVGILAWNILFPSPERIIRKRLNELAQTASFSAKEGLVAKAWNASLLSGFFTPDVEVTVEVPGRQQTLNGRDELLQAAAQARTMLTSLSIEFPDIKVTLAPDRTSATVNLTARGKVSSERDTYLQELRMRVIKVKREWLINQIETVRTLSQGRSLQRAPCLEVARLPKPVAA